MRFNKVRNLTHNKNSSFVFNALPTTPKYHEGRLPLNPLKGTLKLIRSDLRQAQVPVGLY